MKNGMAKILLSALVLLSATAHGISKDEAIRKMKRFEGTGVKGVDTSTLHGKVVCGYQGWFSTPDDGFGLGWKHYASEKRPDYGKFRPGACSIDFWPHTADYPEDALAATEWKKADGSTAKVFTSNHPSVVMTHFEWMRDYGIEAAFLQRFSGATIRDPNTFHKNNEVLDYVRKAANATGRAYCVMYDGGVRDRAGLEKLKNDWKLLVDRMGITKDPNDTAYLHHNGKPLVAFWGFGFTHRRVNLELALEFVEWLKNDPVYGGCSVMLGLPTNFRALNEDAVADPLLHKLIEAADVASPWAAGRYKDMEAIDNFTEDLWKPDMAWCAERGVDYLPCVFPGFSWANLMKDAELSDDIPRHGGHFLWKQFANLMQHGAGQIYVGMFDEIDEGTQILKVDNDPPATDKDVFLSYAPQPEDHYLWLTGQAQKMLRGEIAFSAELPKREGYTYPEKPKPVPTIGTYYYPWYQVGKPKEGWSKWSNAMRLHLKHRQEPMAGLYDSRDPEVVRAHIEQSLRGGIDFWSVSWWGPGTKTDRIFKEAVWTHPDSAKLKYAMLYESTGRFGKFEAPNYDKWIGDLKYLKKTYFDDPRYLRIDGRPVLFVYLSREYFRNRGQDALKQMREQFPEIYLVGDDVFFGVDAEGVTEDTYKAEWAANFDAVTAYDVYGQSVGPLGGTQKALDFLAGNYAMAKREASSAGVAFMPAVAPGYNDTAVRDGHPGRARYFTDREHSNEGDVFRAMIHEVALPHVDTACGNIMMVTSFNEWYEDSQIEPTAGTEKPSTTDRSESGTHYTGGQEYVDYGYLYLDILREETGK